MKANKRGGKPGSAKCCRLSLELKALVTQVRYSGVADCFCFRLHVLLGCYLSVTKSLSFTVNAAQLSRSLRIWQNRKREAQGSAGKEQGEEREGAGGRQGVSGGRGTRKRQNAAPGISAWSGLMGWVKGPPGWTSLDHPVTETY